MTDIDDLSLEKFAEQVEKEYENNISEENIKDIENAVNAESDVMKFMAQYEVPATINNINEVRKLLKNLKRYLKKQMEADLRITRMIKINFCRNMRQ